MQKKPAPRKPVARAVTPTVGKTFNYTVKGVTGRGKVQSTHSGKTGTWVTLFNAERKQLVTVRPSQLSTGR